MYNNSNNNNNDNNNKKKDNHIYVYIYIYIYIYIYVYIYIYIYIWALSYPPPDFWPPHRLSHSRLSPKSCNLRHYVNTWSTTCHNKPRKLHESGGTKDTGDRTWDLLHQRADPHQLSYTCNFPLVLFLSPPLSNGKGFYLINDWLVRDLLLQQGMFMNSFVLFVRHFLP